MDKKVTAPCEACGGLLPLKPIQTRRRVKQRQRQRNQDESKDSHHSQGSTNKLCENSEELEESLPLSDDSEESSGKMRSYDSVLEEIQAIFANQKVKRETISPYIHRDHRHRERRANEPKRHERSQAHQHAIYQRASESEHKWPSKSRSPANTDSSYCFLHPHEGRQQNNEPTCKRIGGQNDEPTCKRISGHIDEPNCKRIGGQKDEPTCKRIGGQSDEPTCKRIGGQSDEPTCKRIVGQFPQDDASNCSFDPLRISPSPRIHAAQSCIHHLSEHSAREQVRGKADTAGGSSPPEKNSGSHHGDLDNHRDTTCRPKPESPAERNTQPRMDNHRYHDILRLYEKCHIHQIDEHITTTLLTSPRGARPRSQRHGCEERSSYPQSQQQLIYSCHQHTVVRHHEGCHLHPELPAALLSPRKCQRCGCPERDYSVPKEVSLQGPVDHSVRHHSPKACVKTERIPEQEVVACAQRLSPKSPRSPRCKLHGDCSAQKVDVCGICCHPKTDHKDQDPSPARKEKIQGCHLHGLPSPKCQEAKVNKNYANPKCNDPLVWTPRRVRKPKLCSSVHWLDRIVASRKFPSHIIQQFLQGKRKCPPRVKKPKCPACVAKCLKEVSSRDPCEREVAETWNSGSDIADSTIECKQRRRGKLSRLALSRSLIIKPVVKLSTSQGPWTTRKEFQVCSECRNPLVTKSGRWKSMLEEMSAGLCDEGEIPKKCSTKFSCQTIHGLVMPSDTGALAVDLRCPELYSAFRLHSKLQKVQNETFDRHAAMQVAETEGIELDKELFDQLLPEIKKPNKGSPRRSSKGSPRSYVCSQQRREVYRDLCKIVEPPMPVCQVQAPLRDVGVQVTNTGRPPEDFNLWNPSDFGAEPCSHSDRTVQSSLQPCTPNPTKWPNCQAQEKSWDEQHWAYLVEACKQARMEQGVYGSCAACQ